MRHRHLLKRIVALTLLSAAIILFMGAGATPDQRFNDLGHKLMCKCGCGQVLLECNHVGCTYSDRMRKELVAAIDKGDNDSMVLQAFVQKYGPTVLAAPTTTGFNRVAWIMPFAALFGGILLTITLVRAWRHRAAAPAVVAPADMSSAAFDSLRHRVHEETEL
ncbi:MAG: cytochrome c-type biogenesis protein [Terriglobales bacterium]